MQLASGSLPPAGGASGASQAIGSVNFFLIVSLVDPRYRWSESLGPLLAGALVTMFCQCTLCSCSATDNIRVHWVPVLPAYHSDSRRATAFNQVSVAFLFCSISVVPLQSHLWLHCSQTNFPALSCFLCSALPFLHSPLLSTWYLPVHSSRLNVYIFFLENLLDFARLSVILL